MNERDIVELADIKSRVLGLLPFSSLLSVSTLCFYFAYRLKCLLLTEKPLDDQLNVLNSALYFVTELGLLCQQIVPSVVTSRLD